MTRRLLPALLAPVMLAGCVVGPNYAGPASVAPRAEGGAGFVRAGPETTAAAPALARWWTALRDPQLDRLMDAALAANPDVEGARARLRQSRAALREAGANRLPSVNANALYLRTRTPGGILGGGAAAAAAQGAGDPSQAEADTDDALEFYNLGLDASWELDLFGGRTRAVQSARAQAQALQANLQDVQVSLTAEVAAAYVQLRDLQQRLALSRRNAEIAARMLELTRLRRAGGTASDLDLERLNTQLQSSRADLVPLQAQITTTLDRIAVLTGREPGAWDGELGTPGALPLPPATVAVGDPAGLLRRRPDVRAAERRLAQQTAVIGQRVADLFPKVQFLGTLGFGGTDLGSLLGSDTFTYVLAPTLRWNVLDFGRVRSRIGQAEAGRDLAAADYRKTVLGALQDAETSLARYGRQREALTSLVAVQASADRAARLNTIRVQGGTASTLDQLEVERRRVEAEAGVSQAKAQLTQDYVSLQKSLGLGWASEKAG